MKIVADLHTHTISCGHAYSSLPEMAQGARLHGLKILATTDHGPNMPGTRSLAYFEQLISLPEYIAGVRVLKGAECNIAGLNGELDIPDRILKKLELVLVGFHPYCGYEGQGIEDHTRAMIGAITHPLVDLVVHPGNPNFPIDVKRVVQAAMENDVIIEVNNSSFRGSRKGSWQNCTTIAQECLKQGVMISVDSDAHISFDVGRLDLGLKLIDELQIKPAQVINTSEQKILDFVQQKQLVKQNYQKYLEV